MQKILYIICLMAVQRVSAQSVTGSWYGKADVEMSGLHSNYLTELVIKQTGNRVDGVFGYYFRDKYQSFFVHGRYNPRTRQVIIENIPVIYYNSNSTVNSIDCNTSFVGVIVHSKLQSTLKGAFYHDERYKYTCPDLKVTYILDKEDSSHDNMMAMAPVSSRVWKPQADDVVVDVVKTDQVHAAVIDTPAVSTPDIAATAVSQPMAPLVKKDTALAVTKHTDPIPEPAAAAAAVAIPEKTDKRQIAESFSKRKAVVNQTLELESDSVRVSFYDNGEIDGDSISVFVNSQLILTHQELASKALTLYLHLDSTREENNISMFAENLGKYPPNTALMVITDGKNRYEIFLSSSLTENATIQLRRKKAALTGPGRSL